MNFKELNYKPNEITKGPCISCIPQIQNGLTASRNVLYVFLVSMLQS